MEDEKYMMSHNIMEHHIIDRLAAVVAARRQSDAADSYSAQLFAAGRQKIARKFAEEAIELMVEALADDRAKAINESADLLFHLLILWTDMGIAPDDIWRELHRREGTSGLSERAQRRS